MKTTSAVAIIIQAVSPESRSAAAWPTSVNASVNPSPRSPA
jgi:hypothetical protein